MSNVTELKPSFSKVDEAGVPYIVWPEYYQAYKNWCIANGEDPVSATLFTKRMAAEMPDFHENFVYRRVDGKVTRVLMEKAARFPGGGGVEL